MVWFAAFSVYPHLSGADHAVDARLGNALELPGKEIINALPRVVRQDFNVPDAILSIRFSIQIQLIDRLGKGCYIAGLRIVALELANTSSVTPVTLDFSIGKCHWKTQPGFFWGLGPRPSVYPNMPGLRACASRNWTIRPTASCVSDKNAVLSQART